MGDRRLEHGLHVVEDAAPPEAGPELVDEQRDTPQLDSDLESLRDEFVDAFNARDLDAVLVLVADDVEAPDVHGEGTRDLVEELEAIWVRSPATILTRAFLDGAPCAVGWLPDEDGEWQRADLVCFDADDGLLTVVEIPDDADGLARAESEDPIGDELEEWQDWSEWDRGESSDGDGHRG